MTLMTDPPKIARGLTGTAGEYFVAAEMTRRNWLATVTIKNAPGTDVLAQHTQSKRTVAVQTKTSSKGFRKFQLRDKDERVDVQGNEWYVLVGLQGLTQRPDFFVMPRDIVAAVCFLEHRDWRKRTGGRSNDKRDVQMSWIAPYSERWELLERSPLDAPNLLHDSFREASERLGLPDGHPGLKVPPTGVELGGPLPA